MAMAMAEADLPLSPPASPGILAEALMNFDDIMVGDTLPPVPGPSLCCRMEASPQ